MINLTSSNIPSNTPSNGVPMIRKMKVSNIYRVRGINGHGEIKHSRVYQQSSSAVRFAELLATNGFTVRMEQAKDVTFEAIIGGEL
jgi:hypothetical protein